MSHPVLEHPPILRPRNPEHAYPSNERVDALLNELMERHNRWPCGPMIHREQLIPGVYARFRVLPPKAWLPPQGGKQRNERLVS